MNKNTNIERINKIGKLGRVFSRILMIFCIIGTILTAVAVGIAQFAPEHISMITDASNVSELNITELLMDCVHMTVSAIFYFFASRFSKAIETCETPFTDAIIKEMKLFGIVYIVFNCIIGLTETAFGILPSVLTILLLVNVFAYGAELQKESDELL